VSGSWSPREATREVGPVTISHATDIVDGRNPGRCKSSPRAGTSVRQMRAFGELRRRRGCHGW
jgi:hypothetical protein